MSSQTQTKPLVTTDWVVQHAKDSGVRLVEVDVDPSVYDKGHIEGAVGWNWKRDLQDQLARDIAPKDALAELLGRSGITPDTTIVLYGDNNNWFAAYGYWALKYYGHDKVQLVDGGRVKWEKEGRPYSTDAPRTSDPRRNTQASCLLRRTCRRKARSAAATSRPRRAFRGRLRSTLRTARSRALTS